VPAGTQSTPAARCTPHPTHAPCCWPACACACACCPCPARPPRLVSVRRRPMCHRAGRITSRSFRWPAVQAPPRACP
jgi:hypothetical protein